MPLLAASKRPAPGPGALLRRMAVLFLSATSAASFVASAEPDWCRFRGANGVGVVHNATAPVAWAQSDYAWQRDLPGVGHSSPVFWEDHLYLTAGHADGRRDVICINADTGETVWTRSVALDASHLHKKNSYGSGSTVAGAAGVFATFADTGRYVVVAYSHTGSPLWDRDLGSFTSQHGQGSSPILVDDLLIVPNDQMGESSLVALKANSGDVAWRTPKSEGKTAYATACIVVVDGEEILITASQAEGVSGFDPQTGEKLFASGPVPLRVVASPIIADGAVVISCGSGGRGKHMEAIDIGRDGAGWKTAVRWTRTRQLPYVPTPVVVNDLLFLWNDDGTAACIDPTDGSERWKERIGGNFSGSPIAIGDHIYAISEDGRVEVIDAASEFQRHEGGTINAPSYATPAVARGHLYLRGFSTLACLPMSSGS